MHEIFSASHSPSCLSVALYLFSPEGGFFLPCPPSNFSRLKCYSNEVFLDGPVRMNTSSFQLSCTSYIHSLPYLVPHANHTFSCPPHFTWEQTLCFHLYFPSVHHIRGTQYHQMEPWASWCSKYGKIVSINQVYVSDKDGIHSAHVYWL